jgi:hypothetical protein
MMRESPTMRVTFDTNVWKRMVFPERYVDDANYLSLGKIKKAIRCGPVRGFISEGFATVEAVQKKNRAKFHAQNLPKVEITNKSRRSGLNSITIEIKTNHSLHPGIGEHFEEELNQALAIGIKLLTTPYIGLPDGHLVQMTNVVGTLPESVPSFDTGLICPHRRFFS